VIVTTSRPSAAAPRFGDHLPAPSGTLTVDFASAFGAAGHVPGAGTPGAFGPPGFTRAVVPILREFTSSHYAATAFPMSLFGGKPRRNGDSGVVDFAGCTAKQARALLRVLPESNLRLRVGEAPCVRALLEAVVAHPGRLEFGGVIVGPNGANHGAERLEIDGLHVFDDTAPDHKGYAWRVIEARYGLEDAGEMPSMRKRPVRWRADAAWDLYWLERTRWSP